MWDETRRGIWEENTRRKEIIARMTKMEEKLIYIKWEKSN